MWVFDSDLLIIRKTLNKEGKVEIRVNEKLFSQAEFLDLLKECAYQTHNPLNFVLQGKAKQISQLDPSGLYQLFCEVIGTSIYTQSRHESVALLDSTVQEEKRTLELLEEFRERISNLQIDKEDFSKFESTLKTTNW